VAETNEGPGGKCKRGEKWTRSVRAAGGRNWEGKRGGAPEGKKKIEGKQPLGKRGDAEQDKSTLGGVSKRVKGRTLSGKKR